MIESGNVKFSLNFNGFPGTPVVDENYICIQTLVHLVKNGTIILNKPAAPIIFMPLASLRILAFCSILSQILFFFFLFLSSSMLNSKYRFVLAWFVYLYPVA